MTAPEIVLEGLTKRFATVVAVADLTAAARPGRVTAFLGPNGAGKTTTLRMLLGLVAPTSGAAMIGDRPYADLDAPTTVVGATLEATGFHPGRTALDHLRVMGLPAGVDTGRCHEVLALVGLAEVAGRRVGTYSLGMRQRLGLAFALLGDPPVLVLDEPANGLDPEGIRWLRSLLRGLAHEGRTILVSSHALSEVEQTADDVLILDRGHMVRQASMGHLLTAHGSRTLVETPMVDRLCHALDVCGVCYEVRPDSELLVDAPRRLVGELAAEHGVVLSRLQDASADLEELFLSITSYRSEVTR